MPKAQFKESYRHEEIDAISSENPNAKTVIPAEHWELWKEAADLAAVNSNLDPIVKGGEKPF